MLKTCAGVLALAALGLALAAPRPCQAGWFGTEVTYPEVANAAEFQVSPWSHAYQLTPLDQKTWRAKGYSDPEIYLIANVARISQTRADTVAQALQRKISWHNALNQFNVNPEEVRKINPVWLTPEWQAAVARGDWLWVAPRGMQLPPDGTPVTHTQAVSGQMPAPAPQPAPENK
jgi:hypothetical protein